MTASTIPIHCSASSSLFARHSARSRGSHNPRYSAIFVHEFIIYRIYQLLLFVACFRIGSSLRSIFTLPTLVPHSTLHFSAYGERVLRTSSRLPFVGECSQFTYFKPLWTPSGAIFHYQATSNRAHIKIAGSSRIDLDIFLCD